MTLPRSGPVHVAFDASSRPPARFHGSKHRAGPWIISHLPADHDTYGEPYCGMANVLMLKERSLIEFINDLNGDVVTFFRMLRERPDDLIRAVDLTPFAWAEWKLSYEPTADPLERARRFYTRAYLSITGPTSTSTNPGFRRQKKYSRGKNGNKTMTAAAVTFADVSHLWTVARRLKGVTIESEDAIKLMRRYDLPRTLFYVDPPYYPETRTRDARSAYSHEMTHDDHVKLLQSLKKLHSMIALSGYRCELYDDELCEWTRFDRSFRVNGEGSRIESLWLNPAAENARSRPHMDARSQWSLFGDSPAVTESP